MNGSKGFVAVGDAGYDDTNGDEIIDAFDIHVVAAEFLVESIEPLGATFDVHDADTVFGKAFADAGDAPVEIGVAFAHVFLDECEGFFVCFGVEIFECQVFELAFDFADTEPVGDGGEYFHSLARDSKLFIGREVVECPHVVEAVGELDDNNANILRHSEEHFPKILEVVFFA